jgi:hypothetical protein
LTRRLLVPLLLALGLLAVPGSASAAKINVAVGIGDQSPQMFSDANYKALKLKKTRYFIEWDAATHPDELAKADEFVDAANGAGVKVLMHISTNNLTARRAKLPSVAQYKTAVGALIRRYKPRGVTDWGAWNEANHVTQPTFRSPQRAAQFYRTMKTLCAGCTIVALDVLDQRGVESYIKRWFAAAGPSGATAKVIGIHNYSQVNRRITAKQASDKYPGTARIIAAVRKSNRVAKFWYTETGGVVNFGSLTCDTARAANRLKFMFDLLKTYDKDVDRLYSYNWYGADCTGFDAGLVEADGTLRRGYNVFKSRMSGVRR